MRPYQEKPQIFLTPGLNYFLVVVLGRALLQRPLSRWACRPPLSHTTGSLLHLQILSAKFSPLQSHLPTKVLVTSCGDNSQTADFHTDILPAHQAQLPECLLDTSAGTAQSQTCLPSALRHLWNPSQDGSLSTRQPAGQWACHSLPFTCHQHPAANSMLPCPQNPTTSLRSFKSAETTSVYYLLCSDHLPADCLEPQRCADQPGGTRQKQQAWSMGDGIYRHWG